MTHQLHPDIIKAAIGGTFAVTSWTAGQLAQAAESVPPWIKAADTPLVIIGLGYGVVHLWRELKKAHDARIADRDAFLKKLETDSEHSQQSRERLIIATEQQTAEFRQLKDVILNKGK
jgi:hypothetical protein